MRTFKLLVAAKAAEPRGWVAELRGGCRIRGRYDIASGEPSGRPGAEQIKEWADTADELGIAAAEDDLAEMAHALPVAFAEAVEGCSSWAYPTATRMAEIIVGHAEAASAAFRGLDRPVPLAPSRRSARSRCVPSRW